LAGSLGFAWLSWAREIGFVSIVAWFLTHSKLLKSLNWFYTISFFYFSIKTLVPPNINFRCFDTTMTWALKQSSSSRFHELELNQTLPTLSISDYTVSWSGGVRFVSTECIIHLLHFS
jgi:hypothetical protein